MAQNTFNIDPNVTSGTELASLLHLFRDALYTQHSGDTRPTYVQPGMLWLDTSSSTFWLLKRWTGSADITEAEYNLTENTVNFRHRHPVLQTSDVNVRSGTLRDGQVVSVDATSGDKRVWLPIINDPGIKNGFQVTVIKTDDSDNTVTITAQLADRMGGDRLQEITLTAQNQSARFTSDGESIWWVEHGGVQNTTGSVLNSTMLNPPDICRAHY